MILVWISAKWQIVPDVLIMIRWFSIIYFRFTPIIKLQLITPFLTAQEPGWTSDNDVLHKDSAVRDGRACGMQHINCQLTFPVLRYDMFIFKNCNDQLKYMCKFSNHSR